MDLKIARTVKFSLERIGSPSTPTLFGRNLAFLRERSIGFSKNFAGALKDPNHILSRFFADTELSSLSGSGSSSQLLLAISARFNDYSKTSSQRLILTAIDLPHPVRGRRFALDYLEMAEAASLVKELIARFEPQKMSPEISLSQDLADSIFDPEIRFEARTVVLDGLFNCGRTEEAIFYANQAQDPAAQVHCLLVAAEEMLFNQNYKKAEVLADEARRLASEIDHPALQAMIHTRLSELLLQLEFPEEAQNEREAALASTRQIEDRHEQIQSLFALAQTQDFEESLPTLSEAIAVTATIDVVQVKKTVIAGALTVMVEAGEYDAALKQAQASSDQELIDRIEKSIIMDLINKSDLDRALALIREKTNPDIRVNCFLALVKALGDAPSAPAILEEMEGSALMIRDLFMQNLSLVEIAKYHLNLGRTDQARRICDQTLLTTEGMEPSLDIVLILTSAAEVLIGAGDGEIAKPALLKALEILSAQTKTPEVLNGQLMIKIAKLLYQMGEGDRAAAVFEEIASGPIETRLMTMTGLGKALHEIGLREEALDIFGRIKGLLPELVRVEHTDLDLLNVVEALVDLFPNPETADN